MRCNHCGLDNAGIIPSKDPNGKYGIYCSECKGYFSFVTGGRSLLTDLLKIIEDDKK